MAGAVAVRRPGKIEISMFWKVVGSLQLRATERRRGMINSGSVGSGRVIKVQCTRKN